MANTLYYFREGVRGLRHAKLMTAASITTIAVVLFIALAAGVALYNVQVLLGTAAERADVVAYLRDDASSNPTILDALLATVQRFPQVKSAAIVDKNASWQRFAELYGQEILHAVDGNPLPASIEISLKKEYLGESSVPRFTAALAAVPGVENVRYAREWIEFLISFSRAFKASVIGLGIFAFITLYITITSAVKLTIYARQDLVQNMQLVGATRFFIAMPFIVEGILQGLTGGVIASLLFTALRAAGGSLPVSFGPLWVAALPLVPGILFGWYSSSAAVRRFLR